MSEAASSGEGTPGAVPPAAITPLIGVTAHPIWDWAVKVAAPIAVVVSASAYVAGYWYRMALLSSFGFGANVVDLSVQDTVALGYGPLILTLLLYGVLALIAALCGISTGKLQRKFSRRPRSEEARRRAKAVHRFARMALYVAGSLLLVFLGGGAGGAWGEIDAKLIANTLDGNCKSGCFRIRTSRGEFSGVLLVQTKDTSIYVARGSSYVLATSSIKSVSRSRLPQRHFPDIRWLVEWLAIPPLLR